MNFLVAIIDWLSAFDDITQIDRGIIQFLMLYPSKC